MLNKTATWNDTEVSKIEDRVQCQICSLKYERPGGTFFVLVVACSKVSRKSSQQASRAKNQQSVHHVRPWHPRSSIEKKLKDVDVMETLQKHKKSKQQENTWIPRTSTTVEKIMERCLTDEQDQKRMRKPTYTKNELEEFDSVALERENYVATPDERAYCRDKYKVVEPYQGGGSNTAMTEEHPGNKLFVPWHGENLTSQSNPQNPMQNCGQQSDSGPSCEMHLPVCGPASMLDSGTRPLQAPVLSR